MYALSCYANASHHPPSLTNEADHSGTGGSRFGAQLPRIPLWQLHFTASFCISLMIIQALDKVCRMFATQSMATCTVPGKASTYPFGAFFLSQRWDVNRSSDLSKMHRVHGVGKATMYSPDTRQGGLKVLVQTGKSNNDAGRFPEVCGLSDRLCLHCQRQSTLSDLCLTQSTTASIWSLGC